MDFLCSSNTTKFGSSLDRNNSTRKTVLVEGMVAFGILGTVGVWERCGGWEHWGCCSKTGLLDTLGTLGML